MLAGFALPRLLPGTRSDDKRELPGIADRRVLCKRCFETVVNCDTFQKFITKVLKDVQM